MRIGLVAATCWLCLAGCTQAQAIFRPEALVSGPEHRSGVPFEHALMAQCSGHEVEIRWDSQGQRVMVSIDGATQGYGRDVAFVAEMFAPGTRPASYWVQCRSDDFEVGATLVTAAADGLQFNAPVVWFSFDGELGGYTGMQVEPTEIAVRRLD